MAQLKTVEIEGETYAAVRDGQPVYVIEGGKEETYDVPAVLATAKATRAERDEVKAQLKEASARLEQYKDLDPDEAAKALKTLRALDDKKLFDADKVDEAVGQRLAEAKKEWEEKVNKLTSDLESERRRRSMDLLRRKFYETDALDDYFITPKLALSEFQDHFIVDGDNVIAYYQPPGEDKKGEPIYSASNPGDYADVGEALVKLLQRHPDHDKLKKGSGASGSGAPGSDGSGSRGPKQKTREEFDALPPAERSKFINEGGELIDAA